MNTHRLLNRFLGVFLASAVFSSSAYAVLPSGVQDVTGTMANDTPTLASFVPSFTFTNTAGLTLANDTTPGADGVYYSPNAGSGDFTVAADGTTLGMFDLTALSFTNFSPTQNYTFTITGTKADLSPDVTTTFDATGQTFTSGNYASFTGLTAFRVVFAGTNNTNPSNITFDSFTISNAAAPVTNTAPTAGTVTANNVTQANAGATSYTFTIGYSDGDGNFDSSTIDTSDVTVSGGAAVSNASYSGNATSGTATYTVTPPGGSWDDGDNGTYTIAIVGSQVGDSDASPLYVAANASAATFSVSMDTTAPTVSSVTVPANATYVAGQNLDFTVNTTENVTVNTGGGTPTLALTIGATGKTAAYVSGSGTLALVFRYTVEAGLNDADGIALGAAITLNAGTMKDGVGNDLTTTLNSVGSLTSVLVDSTVPTITNVTIPNVAMKVGDAVIVSITAGEAGLSLNSGSVNGVAVTGFSDLTGGNYSATYTVQEGNIDRAVGDSIPVSFVLNDAAGNSSATYTTAITQNADSIDANSPTISSVTIPNTAMKVGDAVSVSITASEAGLSLNSGSVNGVAVTGFTDLGGGSYGATYTVQEGNIDRAVGDSIPVSFVLNDAAGNSSATYTTAITQNADSIDANSPSITNVTIPNAAMKVGDVVTVTITVGDDGGDTYTNLSGMVGGFTLSSLGRTNSTTYTAQFTVTEGGTDVAAGSNIPVSVSLTDSAGNTSNTYTTAISQGSDAIDANSPGAPSGILAVDENAANSTAVGTVSSNGATGFSLTDNAGGRFAIDGSGNVTVADGSLLNFESATSHNITVRATDNAGNTTDAILVVTINNVNEAPTVSNLNGDAVSFSIGGSAVTLDASSNAALSDVDSIDFGGGNVTVAIVANSQSGEDALSIGTVGAISTSGSNVIHTDGVTIGTYTGGSSGSSLVITLNANATVARVQDLLRALQYIDTDAATINTLVRTVRITVNDGDGGSSISANQDVTVSLVRAPIIDLDVDNSSGNTSGGYNGSFTEDGSPVQTSDSDTTITDDGTFKSLTVTLTNRLNGTSESLSSTYGTGAQTVNSEAVTIGAYNSSTGVLAITVDDGSATAVTMQLLMESIRYNNTSNAPDTTSRNISYSATDDGNNVGATVTAVISMTAVNDSPVGTAVISGGQTPPVVGDILSADTSGISDADGLGAFSYQWKRGVAAISSATTASYTLVSADVGSAISVTASYTDGGGTVESVSSVATAAVDGDLDGDTIGDSSDPDIDGDGMTNVYEDANGLNKWSAADRDTDLDGDGVSNYDEFVAGKLANVDDYPPVVTPPVDVTVNSLGLFTPVTIGTANAVDAKDGLLVAVSDAPTHFSPGVHTVTWSATDAAGNRAEATQTVNVVPMVSFSKDQNTAEGAAASFGVILNGPAVTYPVTVPYTVSGTATSGADYTALSGTVDITASNLSVTVPVTISADGITGEPVETLIVTLGAPTNAVVGAKSTHTISIHEGNVAPMVALSAVQSGGETRLILQNGADVVVTASVTDANVADTHTFNWSATDNALSDTDGAGNNTFTFTPSTVGLYTLRVTATDNGAGSLSDSAELTVNVVAALPALGGTDSDGDNVIDSTEGSGDSDGDGVPNYLDHSALQNNVLQELALTENQYIIETEPGLSLSLSHIAFAANNGRADVSMVDITNGGGVSDDTTLYGYPGGLFDFTVGDLPVAGQSVTVVLPQLSAVPVNAVYRKLIAGVWQEFVVNANNSLASAAGAAGYCPPPGDAAYSAGLTAGHWCVQLTLEDGGPNDADGVANNSVVDPGGVAAILATDVNVEVTSGGGGVAPLWLLLMGLFGLPRLLAARKGRAVQ